MARTELCSFLLVRTFLTVGLCSPSMMPMSTSEPAGAGRICAWGHCLVSLLYTLRRVRRGCESVHPTCSLLNVEAKMALLRLFQPHSANVAQAQSSAGAWVLPLPGWGQAAGLHHSGTGRAGSQTALCPEGNTSWVPGAAQRGPVSSRTSSRWWPRRGAVCPHTHQTSTWVLGLLLKASANKSQLRTLGQFHLEKA